MAILHVARDVWSFLKDTLEDEGFSSTQLGTIDMLFLFFYSAGLFVAGVVGDHFNFRYVLTLMFMLVGLAILMTGFGYIWGIRGIWWYYLWQALHGLFQSGGFPLCIATMGAWFPKKGRGIILGVWSATSPTGDIMGVQLAHLLFDELHFSWMWTYIVSGLIVLGYGVLLFFVLVDHPSRVGLEVLEHENAEGGRSTHSPNATLARGDKLNLTRSDGTMTLRQPPQKAVTFWRAWLIPGVAAYAFSYLALKTTNLGINNWLPTYASEELHFNPDEKAQISSIY